MAHNNPHRVDTTWICSRGESPGCAHWVLPVTHPLAYAVEDPQYFMPFVGSLQPGDRITIQRYEGNAPMPPQRELHVLKEFVTCLVVSAKKADIRLLAIEHIDMEKAEAATKVVELTADPTPGFDSAEIGDPMNPAEQKRGPGRPRKVA